MVESKRKRQVILILGTAILSILLVGLGVALLTARISTNGAASLSDGREIKVVANLGIMDDGVAISSFKDRTTVNAGNYLVEFVATDIVVNGKSIGDLPEGGSSYNLVIDRTSGVKVLSDDVVVAGTN